MALTKYGQVKSYRLKCRVKEEQLLRIPRRAGRPQRRFCYINYTQTHTYTRARARTHTHVHARISNVTQLELPAPNSINTILETAKGDLSGPINPLNAELNPICRLLALLGAHYILHVSRVRVKVYWLKLLTS
jgi:hypothetical protein